jgi:hypothetical protein
MEILFLYQIRYYLYYRDEMVMVFRETEVDLLSS